MSPGEAAFAFAVVAEGKADQQIANGLAARVVARDVDWIDEGNVGDFCRWQGLDPSGGYLAWKSVTHVARDRGIATHGRFRDSPGVFDERRARTALRLFKSLEDRPAAILLVRDTDGEPGRVSSLERVRESGDWEFQVLLATPDPKRECWVLAGFDPTSANEEAALEEVRSDLGFDPRLHADRLTARGAKGKRNAKKVLERLLSPGTEREESCWRDGDLDVLGGRGERSRLRAFLEEVSDRLVPLLSGRTA